MIFAILFRVKLLKIKLGPRLTIVSLPRLKTIFSHIGVTLLITLEGGGSIMGTGIFTKKSNVGF
jgi:hypothetical protein